MHPLSKKLDTLSDNLELKGLMKEASELDAISNTLDLEASDNLEDVMSDVTVDASEELSDEEKTSVAASEYYVEEALEQIRDASLEMEAARKRKRKWIKGVKVEKGRLGKYRRKGESMSQAAHRALKSDDPSVRGMGSFYIALHGKKKDMEAEDSSKEAGTEISSAELRGTKDRPAPIFPKESPKVKDDKDHFPIPDAAHGQNALARVNQYGGVPSWYSGSLKDLKDTVVKAVKSKFPGMEIDKEKFNPEE